MYDNVLKTGLKARKTPEEVLQYTVFNELSEEINAEREKESTDNDARDPPALAAEPLRETQVSAYMTTQVAALAGEETKSKNLAH